MSKICYCGLKGYLPISFTKVFFKCSRMDPPVIDLQLGLMDTVSIACYKSTKCNFIAHTDPIFRQINVLKILSGS